MYAKYDPNPSVLSQDIEWKPILGINQGPLTLLKWIWDLCANNKHIFRPWPNHLWSFKTIGLKLMEELRSRDTHWLIIWEVSKPLAKNCKRSCIHKTPTDYKGLQVKTDLVKKAEKVEKINLIIMSKQYAHLHTMAKTSVKFQNDWPKTVGGVMLTRHQL